jgi:uncharacterized protein YebE (UPF0316 family)
MSDFDYYTWMILPLLIFLARISDVSLGTIRVIFISKGLKYLAAVIGFFEILIWLLAIGQIMKNLSNPVCYVAYAGGFAMGNFAGIWIAERLSIGVVLIRVVTKKDASELLEHLKSGKYGVTSVDGYGSAGQVKIVFTIVPRREVARVADVIKRFNPKAFYSIEEVRLVKEGIFPTRKSWRDNGIKNIFKPFRKGK